MNKRVEPSVSSVTASEWFADYLKSKIKDDRKSAVKLAEAVGVERKAIYSYYNGERSPKLEVVAKILAFYGETEIRIPLKNKS